MSKRGVIKGALAVVGVLFVLSVLRGGRGFMGELAPLIAVLGVAFFAVRWAWRWWMGQPPTIASLGVLAALGVSGVGWLLVGLVHALKGVSSENYGMIIVWPLVLVMGTLVFCASVLAVGVGVAAIVTAMTRLRVNRELTAFGGVAAVVLNVLHVVTLVRVLYAG